MPVGQPTKITPALVAQISEALLFGFTDEEIAILTDISRKTITRMRAGSFCPQVKRAELQRRTVYIRRISEGRRQDWQRWAWILERRFPLLFAKPEVQLNVNNDNRQVHQTLIISAEVAGNINDRMKATKSKVQQLLKDKRPGASNGA